MKAVWNILRSHVEFSVPSRLVVIRETVELPDGRVVPDYYKVQLPDFVLVLAESTEGNIVCLEQYRHGTGCFVLTLPGGHVEDGEDELVAAKRELIEETGFEAAKWEKIGSFCTLGNQRGSVCTVFYGSHAHRVTDPSSGDLEKAQVRVLSRDRLLQSVSSGQVAIASDLAAIGLVLARLGVPRTRAETHAEPPRGLAGK